MRAYISIGSNIGDRLFHLREAVRLLQEKDVPVKAAGRIYETEPVGFEEQDWFLNTVVAVETNKAPRNLLQVMQEVENELGRKREIRWGPRTVDLDLLLYEDRFINEPDLVVPHPRMEERAFVLFPLRDIAPEMRMPSGRHISDVINNLSENKKIFCTKDKVLVE